MELLFPVGATLTRYRTGRRSALLVIGRGRACFIKFSDPVYRLCTRTRFYTFLKCEYLGILFVQFFFMCTRQFIFHNCLYLAFSLANSLSLSLLYNCLVLGLSTTLSRCRRATTLRRLWFYHYVRSVHALHQHIHRCIHVFL